MAKVRTVGLSQFEQAVNMLYTADAETPNERVAAAREVILEKVAQTRTVEQVRRLLGDTRTWMGTDAKDETTKLVEACLVCEDRIK